MERNICKDIKTKIGSQGLVIIAVIVIAGALLTFIVKANEETPGDKIGNSIAEVIDSADEDFDEFREEVEDEIDDHTDSR